MRRRPIRWMLLERRPQATFVTNVYVAGCAGAGGAADAGAGDGDHGKECAGGKRALRGCDGDERGRQGLMPQFMKAAIDAGLKTCFTSAQFMSNQSRQLFGTDGIRGVAGEFPLTEESTYLIGRALGHDLVRGIRRRRRR